jgi:hypothetical protein
MILILEIAAGIVLGFFALWAIAANNFWLLRAIAFLGILGLIVVPVGLGGFYAYSRPQETHVFLQNHSGALWVAGIFVFMLIVGGAINEDAKANPKLEQHSAVFFYAFGCIVFLAKLGVAIYRDVLHNIRKKAVQS